jgi:saccharopine dehydrogenase-like NADP-dependent oxidoreductase
MKRVLVLGAGMVAGPLVGYLLKDPDLEVTLADTVPDKAEKLLGDHRRGRVARLDVGNRAELSKYISRNDLTVSLLPHELHVGIAEICIEHKKSMVNTSYVSERMAGLDSKARGAGILILSEIGLDPGIDHMSAMRIIDGVKSAGGRITHFRSYCGGLPAPEANDNPFGYKVSWSPRGLVMAGRSDSRYLEESKEIRVPGKDLFSHHYLTEIDGVGRFEAYPNRDSIPYMKTYGIEGAVTMYRGTLRNIGWCDAMKSIGDIGYFDDRELSGLNGSTYGRFTSRLVGLPDQDARRAAAAFLKIPPDCDVIKRLEWLGLFGDIPLPPIYNNAMDYLADLIRLKMVYREGERDMIVLFHDFRAEFPDGAEKRITSVLVEYGIPGGDSAMSRTVGLPAAAAARLALEGKIGLTGVHIPVSPAIYKPVLAELDRMNIRCKEETG